MSRFSILTSFALRDASKNRILLILIVASLSVAFSAIFISASVFEGFQQMLAQGEIGWLSHLLLSPDNNQLSITNTEEVIEELNKIDNIESFSVRTYGIAGIRYKDKFISPYKALGIEPFNEEKTSKLFDSLVEGNFIKSSKSEEVVLGLNLADSLVGLTFDKEKIAIGEEIQVIAMNGNHGLYKIGGIIDAKTFLPNWLLIFNKEELEKLDNSQKNGEIIIRLKDADKMEETKNEIKEKDLGINVATWREQSGYIDDIMAAVSFITILINRLLTASIFVIISVIIFINVFQKRRQIGILKSMGANNRFVISIYVLETFVYASLSYIIAFLIFLLIHQYSLNNPVSLLIGDFHTIFNIKIVWSSLLTLFGAALAGSFIPAYIAAKTKIIDVIKGTV